MRDIPEVTKFRKAADAAGSEGNPGVELGTDFRIESRRVSGFALTLNEKVLHLSVFAREDRGKGNGHESRMGRFSQRRRNR